MKKAIIIALAGISLAGCGTKTIVVQQTVPPKVSVPVTQAPMSDEDTFFQNVMNEYPTIVANAGRQWVIDLGNTLCDSIDEGMSFAGLAQMGSNANVDLEMLGYITGEAIRNLCPRNQWFIDSALSS